MGAGFEPTFSFKALQEGPYYFGWWSGVPGGENRKEAVKQGLKGGRRFSDLG